MPNKYAIRTVLLISALTLVLGPVLLSKAAGAEKLTTLYSSNSLSQSLPWIARELGLFRKYNVDPDIVYIPSSAIAVAALLSGEVDVAMAGGVGFIRAFVQGASDLVLVGGSKNFLTFSIVGRPGVNKPEDLKGKKLGVTRLGSNSHYFVVQVLRRFGLDASRDVTLIQTGGETDVITALLSGSVDAATAVPPLDLKAIGHGFHYIYVAYGPELGVPYPAADIVTRRSVIAKRPEIIGDFMRALAEASKVLHTDRESADKVLRKLFRVSDKKMVDHAYETEIKVLDRRLDVNPAGIQAVLQDIAKTDPRAKRVVPQDLIDRRYLVEMDKSGFFARLWPEK
jgi:NitT/TauT family transport system substrate-binding protein